MLELILSGGWIISVGFAAEFSDVHKPVLVRGGFQFSRALHYLVHHKVREGILSNLQP